MMIPPKTDPYATKSARTVDLLLILLALLTILFAVWTAPRHQSETSELSSTVATGSNASLAPLF